MTTTVLTVIAVLLRIISNPLGNVFQKKLTANGNHPLVVNFLTYLLLSFACIVYAWFIEWKTLATEFWIYSIIAGCVGAGGNAFLVKALQQGDLSVIGPINAYKSIVGLIFGIILLQEIPNLLGLTGILLVVIGSYFILDTTQDRFSIALLKRPEIKFRIWALILSAVEAVLIKKIILASTPPVAFISWCVFGSVFSFIFLQFSGVKIYLSKITGGDHKNFFFLIICIGIMQIATNYSFAHLPVGYALCLFQLSTILSVWFGYRIFREQDIRKKFFGSLIMLLGSVLIILMKD